MEHRCPDKRTGRERQRHDRRHPAPAREQDLSGARGTTAHDWSAHSGPSGVRRTTFANALGARVGWPLEVAPHRQQSAERFVPEPRVDREHRRVRIVVCGRDTTQTQTRLLGNPLAALSP
jgi:hypothetical protein